VGVLAGRFTRVLQGRRAVRNLNVAAGSIYVGLGMRVAAER
jgi:threonine/homoserine/homoserine lactone efflux protein